MSREILTASRDFNLSWPLEIMASGTALLIKGINFIEAISSYPHLNGGLAESSLQD
jgi:hypothetical protein